ncbi:MAG: hypothetical protein WCY05_04155 [Candidatus Omnitrophota bacterium]
MIRILINNKQLWLPPDVKLRYEVKSPFTQSEVIPESVITWFDIPAVQPNIDILNRSHYIEVNRTTRAYNVVCEFAGIPLINGKLVIKNVSELRYRACCINTAFNIDFGELLLPACLDEETVMGTTTQDVVDYADASVLAAYPESTYQFPRIQNDKFYGDANEFNADYFAINYYDASGSGSGEGTNGFKSNSINQDPTPDNEHTLLPMPYLMHVVTKLFEYANFNTFGSFFDHADLKKLIVYNNYAIDKKENKYFTRTSITAPQVIYEAGMVNFNDDSTDPNEDTDNCFSVVTHLYTIPSVGYHTVKTRATITTVPVGTTSVQGCVSIDTEINIVDQFTFYPNIEGIHTYTFYAAAGDVGKKIMYIFYNAFIADNFTVSACEMTINNTSWDNLNVYAKSINLKHHVPQQKKVSEFLNAITDAFGIATWWDPAKREVEMQLTSSIMASQEYIAIDDYVIEKPDTEIQDDNGYTYNFDFGSNDELVNDNFRKYSNYNYLDEVSTFEDLEVYPKINDVTLVKNLNTLYIYKVDETTNVPGWIEFTDNFFDLIKGDKALKPSLSTLFNIYIISTLRLYRPEISQLGNSPAFDTGVNDCDLKLLLYHGIRHDGLGYHHPLASHTAYDYLGNKIGDLELRWDGTLGLYAKLRQPLDDFMNGCERTTTKLTCDIALFEQILSMFKPQRYARCRKIMYKSIKFIPEQFTFMLTMKGVEETEAILLKSKGITIQ